MLVVLKPKRAHEEVAFVDFEPGSGVTGFYQTFDRAAYPKPWLPLFAKPRPPELLILLPCRFQLAQTLSHLCLDSDGLLVTYDPIDLEPVRV